MRVPICVLVLGIRQFILKSSAAENSTSLFYYIKLKYTEIYYYFAEHKSRNRFNIHYLRTDFLSLLAMCFSKCVSLFIYCCVLNHCLCPHDCWWVSPFSLDEPISFQGRELLPNNRNLDLSHTKYLLTILLDKTQKKN